MAIRNVVQIGDDILRKKCRPVEVIDDKIRELLDDMVETMREHDGAGLAACQVGILKRIFVVEIEDGKVYEMINPQMLEQSGENTGEEGCLSVLGKVGTVTRPSYVKMKAQDRDGAWVTVEAEDILAKAFSHEYDHLDGIIYVDKAKDLHFIEE